MGWPLSLDLHGKKGGHWVSRAHTDVKGSYRGRTNAGSWAIMLHPQAAEGMEQVEVYQRSVPTIWLTSAHFLFSFSVSCSNVFFSLPFSKEQTYCLPFLSEIQVSDAIPRFIPVPLKGYGLREKKKTCTPPNYSSDKKTVAQQQTKRVLLIAKTINSEVCLGA